MNRWAIAAVAVMMGWICVVFAGAGYCSENPGEEVGSNPVVIKNQDLVLELHSAIQYDFVWFDRNERGSTNTSDSQGGKALEHRARLAFKGKLFDNIGFYLQAAFELDTALIDAQINLPLAPFSDITVGLMKMPFSGERLKSYATHQPFLERSLASNLDLRRSQGGVIRFHLPDSDAVNLYLGLFTGENMTAANTDDDDEYVGRLVLKLNALTDSIPGSATIATAYARGNRIPNRGPTNSFSGRTMNNFTFFSPVPVNGYRTRWELDGEWRIGPVWFGGEYISSEEERHHVTVNIKTAAGTDKYQGDLKALEEQGWHIFFVWVITGEEAMPLITPANEYGAWSIALRYSYLNFDPGNEKIPSVTYPGFHGHEFNDTSIALGRSSIGDTLRDLYVGVNWDIKTGVFVQFAVVWQWFDYSSPYTKGNNIPEARTSDVNYRARVGVSF
jgi:phosphate-selective porin